MKFLVAKPFTLETPQRKVTLPVGKILELSQDQADQLLRAGFITEAQTFEVMEKEYFNLLARFWSIDNDPPGILDNEADRVLARLDALYQELHRQGRKVPVRLPVERNREFQREMAL